MNAVVAGSPQCHRSAGATRGEAPLAEAGAGAGAAGKTAEDGPVEDGALAVEEAEAEGTGEAEEEDEEDEDKEDEAPVDMAVSV